MFGIGGSEIFLIVAVFLMLFGSDKVPEMARTLAKGMAQLKNATNDIKSEIQKSAFENGLDKESLTSGITKEIDEVRSNFDKMIQENDPKKTIAENSIITDIQKEVDDVADSIEEMSGPIKRQR